METEIIKNLYGAQKNSGIPDFFSGLIRKTGSKSLRD
jgi:hypothetical protein